MRKQPNKSSRSTERRRGKKKNEKGEKISGKRIEWGRTFDLRFVLGDLGERSATEKTRTSEERQGLEEGQLWGQKKHEKEYT